MENAYGPGFKTDLEDFIQPLLQPLWEKHALVARKLLMVVDQLQSASSVEEYQQTGILVRDAWIEFTQKLFHSNSVWQDTGVPGPADAKKMLEHIVMHWPSCPEKLIKVSKGAIDLANEVQHKRTIDLFSAKWCLLATLFAMLLMLDLDSQYDKLADRRYYKCPNCGSLRLVCKRDIEVSYDGPGPEYERWNCEECDWEQFHYLD